MNKKLAAFSDVLHEPIAGLQRLRADDFEQKFEDDVADLHDTFAVRWRVVPTVGEIIELSNGYAVHCDRTSRYSLFETEQHYNERTLLSAWAKFVRGTWTDFVPQEPGVYFVRDRDLGKRFVRELRRESGRLIDVSGGQVAWGTVTAWRGQWWSIAVPPLPGAY